MSSPTNLVAACRSGIPEFASVFLELCSDINAVDPQSGGDTPLTASSSSPGCVSVLLEAGASPNRNDSSGRSPLSHATFAFVASEEEDSSERAQECMRLLLQKKADPHQPSRYGWTPAMELLSRSRKSDLLPIPARQLDHDRARLVHALLQGDLKGIRSLAIAISPDFQFGPTGHTPLSWCAHFGKARLVEELVAAGADPNFVANFPAEYRTALHSVAACPEWLEVPNLNEVAQILVQAGVNSSITIEGKGLREIALSNWHEDLAPTLGTDSTGMDLAAAAPPEHQQLQNLRQFVLSAKRLKEPEEISAAAEKAGRDWTDHLLVEQSLAGETEYCQILLKSGADPNRIFPTGSTAVWAAVCSEKVETAELLAQASDHAPESRGSLLKLASLLDDDRFSNALASALK